MSKSILDNVGSENFLKNILKIFVEPEIKKRMKIANNQNSKIPNLVIIRFPPEGKPQVFFGGDNNTGLFLIVKVNKAGIKKHDPIYMDDVSEYIKIQDLPKVIQKNDGYVLILRHNDTWHITFNLMTWRWEMKEKHDRVIQFIEAAHFSLDRANYSAFIANLFDASELLIDVRLLLYGGERAKKHGTRITLYNKYKSRDTDGECIMENHKKLLGTLRNNARYAKNELKMDVEKYRNMLKTLKSAHQNLCNIVPILTEFNGKLAGEGSERCKLANHSGDVYD